MRWLPGAARWPVLHVLLPDAFSPPGAAGFFLLTCPESWRTAGGGAPRPVRWLPGAARWPGPPGCYSTSPGVPPEAARPTRCGGCPVPDGDPGRQVVTLRVLACRRRRRAPPGAVVARCRTVARSARALAGCFQPARSCRVFSSYLPGVLAYRRRRCAPPGAVAARCRTVARPARPPAGAKIAPKRFCFVRSWNPSFRPV